MDIKEIEVPSDALPPSPQSPIPDDLGEQKAELGQAQKLALVVPPSLSSPTLNAEAEECGMDSSVEMTLKRKAVALAGNGNLPKKPKMMEVVTASPPSSPEYPVRDSSNAAIAPPLPESPEPLVPNPTNTAMAPPAPEYSKPPVPNSSNGVILPPEIEPPQSPVPEDVASPTLLSPQSPLPPSESQQGSIVQASSVAVTSRPPLGQEENSFPGTREARLIVEPPPPPVPPKLTQKPSAFVQYYPVRRNCRRMMTSKKYGRLEKILKLFAKDFIVSEPDTFDVIADCLAHSGQEELSHDFREKARSLRNEAAEDDTTTDSMTQLADFIRTGEHDCDLITSNGISDPKYFDPEVRDGVLVSKLEITLETVPGVFIDDQSEIVVETSVQCDNDALEEEVARKNIRAQQMAAASAIEKLHNLVEIAKESRAGLSDDDEDDSNPSATQRLHDLVSNPKDTYQLILMREFSQARYSELSSKPDFIEVELKVHLAIQEELKIDLKGEDEDMPESIKQVAGATFRRRSRAARELMVKKLRNVVAEKALKELDSIAEEVRQNAKERLQRDLNVLFVFWKQFNKTPLYEKTLDRIKDVVLDASAAGLYGCKIQIYGSVPCGLALPDSDLDVNIALPKLKNLKTGEVIHDFGVNPIGNDRDKCKAVLNYLMQFFHRFKMVGLLCIDTAKVPVLRYKDPDTRQEVDLTVSNPAGIILTKLLRHHVSHDRRVWQLVMVIKYWAKMRGISGRPHGFINPLGWTVMVIYFLQHCVMPSISALYRVRNADSKHIARDSIVSKSKWDSACKKGKNKTKIAELLVHFFHFYGYKFDFANDIISLSSQEPKSHDSVDAFLESGSRRPAICIEQPMQPGVNIVRYVTQAILLHTKEELRRGYFGARNVGKGDEFLFAKVEPMTPFINAMEDV